MEKQAKPWTASWCWTRKHLSRPWNFFAYFRRLVELSAKPRSALVRVSADARYTLYVNGQRVHQGPARSFPQFQSYDTLDLSPLLERGTNAICVVAHQFGVPTFFHQYRDASGFLLDGVIEMDGAQVRLDTPDGWVCRQATAWRRDVVRLSVQFGFQEHFDANADPVDWLLPSYTPNADDGWAKPKGIYPVGYHPWLHMEPRGVPLLADHVEPFTSIIAQFHGKNADGYKTTEDVYHFILSEKQRIKKNLLKQAEAMLRDDAQVTTIPPADAEFSMAVLDLGQYRTGHFMLDIAEAAGNEIIDIIFSEVLDRAQLPLIVGAPDTPSHCEEATASRYLCRPGAQRWESFHYYGMRYATLIFRNVTHPLKIRNVSLRQVHATVKDAGSFECSDKMLTKIWLAGRETQRNCLFDTFVDCPWREQAQWWGDARVQGQVTAYAFGDSSILERGIRQMAQSQADDGSLHSHPPSDMAAHRLPDFMMTWVGTLWENYFHTGRTELIRQCLPTMHRLFEFLKSREEEDSLLGAFPGWWVFLDWQSLYKSKFSGVLNMMYLQSLRWASAVCRMAEDADGAGRYAQRAMAVARSIEKYFWDDAAKTWRDGFDFDKKTRLNETSQHMNALAILLDLKPETHANLAREILLKAARSKGGKILTASPFFYAYVLEAMAKTGMRGEVIEIIKDKWSTFIERGPGTLWENWETPKGSYCHAWSASPVYHLMQQALGVMPTAAGWKQVRIAPCLGKLTFARGVVPTPLGAIAIEWKKLGEERLAVRVEIPQGMKAEFIGPMGQSRGLQAGANEFQT